MQNNLQNIMNILGDLQKGLDDKINISEKQKEVLDNYIVYYMAVATNEFLDQKQYLRKIDSLYEKLFEVA